jgi:uncharacterized protein (DUF2235 family)
MAKDKRLIILCDGTQNDGLLDAHQKRTNVVKFMNCLKESGDDGKEQFPIYTEGIGTIDGDKKPWDSATGGSKSSPRCDVPSHRFANLM